ncbi:MAG: FliG C-terminal domain-containing protein [Spirochaetales bacterium]
MANWQLNAYRKVAGTGKRENRDDDPGRGMDTAERRDEKQNGGKQSGGDGPEKRGSSDAPATGAETSSQTLVDAVGGVEAKLGGDGTKRRQVAILLNSLGTEQAADILKRLPPSMAEQLAHESLLMETPDERERAEVMQRFGFTRTTKTPAGEEKTTGLKGAGSHAHSAEERTQAPQWSHAYEALKRAFGARKADRILHKAVPEAGRMRFSFLEELDVRQLGTLFSGESAWVISLVVSQSKPEVAANILKSVDGSIRRDVVARVARMNSVQPDIVERVGESLKKRWREIGTARSPEIGGGVSALAEIMKHMGNESLLEAIRKDDPELATAVRDELYSIDMVLKVQDRQLADVLSNFDDHSIALILKGKTEEIRSKIMRNVSERRAYMVSEEYRDLGPQRRADVDGVTHEFVAHLRKLADEGALLVDGPDDRYI